ncbi:MAG: SEC-C domain-containing protein [SAR324 cluster bacterium]|nr:SEC-C domain-containing protein [SAR324 cluster bacterium]
MKLQRNEKCPCGSGRKYKKCCYPDLGKRAEILRSVSLANNWEELVQLVAKPMEIYQLKVVLIRMGFQEIEEEVSRTFGLEGKHTLYDFHMDIQGAFDWDNDHMFSFYITDKLSDRENEYSANPLGEHLVSGFATPSKSAATAQIRDLGLTEDTKFIYLFDYGDKLVHEVTVEKISVKSQTAKKFPTIINESGTPPPQYGQFEYDKEETKYTTKTS